MRSITGLSVLIQRFFHLPGAVAVCNGLAIPVVRVNQLKRLCLLGSLQANPILSRVSCLEQRDERYQTLTDMFECLYNRSVVDCLGTTVSPSGKGLSADFCTARLAKHVHKEGGGWWWLERI